MICTIIPIGNQAYTSTALLAGISESNYFMYDERPLQRTIEGDSEGGKN